MTLLGSFQRRCHAPSYVAKHGSSPANPSSSSACLLPRPFLNGERRCKRPKTNYREDDDKDEGGGDSRGPLTPLSGNTMKVMALFSPAQGESASPHVRI